MGIEIRSLRSAELGNAAHVVIERDSAVAVVIDPVRDVCQYLEVAAGDSVELAWALETHVHNDFVSGSRELVAASGTRLGASGEADLRYPYERLGDGDEIEIGPYRLRVLATPGHTPEHLAYLLIDPEGESQALFSGGALMVGTAARTDLFGPALSWRFARDLERSLKDKILELPDHVVVYPTHGGGSFCAAGAGSALTTTIGAERAANPLATARSSRVRDSGAHRRSLSRLLRPDAQPQSGRRTSPRTESPCSAGAQARRGRHLARPGRARGRRAPGGSIPGRAHPWEPRRGSRRQRRLPPRTRPHEVRPRP